MVEQALENNTQPIVDNKVKGSDRHYGLELLRILCMLFVIMWHYIEVVIPFDSNLLSMVFIVHVDSFFLLSSYFMCTKDKFHLSRWIRLLFEILFYCVLAMVIAIIMGEFRFDDIHHWTLVFLPITSGTYWFLTAYFVIFFLSPFLNIIIKHISKGAHLILLIFLLVSTIIMNNFLYKNAFGIGYGLCWAWAVVLYFVGAYLRLYTHPEKMKWWILIPVFFALCFLHCLFASLLKIGLDNENQFVKILFGDPTFFRRYNNFLTLGSAITFFFIFSKIHISNKVVVTIISFISRHSLASYLLHCHPLLSYHFGYGAWQLCWEMEPHRWLAYFIFVGIIFFGSIAVDVIRSLLVKSYSWTPAYKKLMKWFDALPYRFIKRVNNAQ